MRMLLMGLLLISSTVLAQDEHKGKKDQIGKTKAGKAVLKALIASGKLKQVHCKEEIAAGDREPFSYEGAVRKDFCAMKGPFDIYARQGNYLVLDPDTDKFVAPVDVAGEEGAKAAGCRNPYTFLMEVKTLVKVASWMEEEEKVGEVDCKVAELKADEKTLLDQVQEFAEKVRELRERKLGKITGYIDKKASTSTYRIWIGKNDLQVHKLTWKLVSKLKEKALPPGIKVPTDKMQVLYTLTFTKHGEKVDVEIPNEVKQRLKVK